VGKRSSFARKERDFYPTPYEAVLPLLPHLPPALVYDEPCAGEGDLIRHLQKAGHRVDAHYDLAEGFDARAIQQCYGAMFITNPPWPVTRGEPTLSIAKHLSELAPTWLLLSADFCHNLYFAEIAPRCQKIVSVGRVSWEGNGTKGKDNCAWYLFDLAHKGPTEFYGRSK